MSPRYDDDWTRRMVNVDERLDGVTPRQFLLDAGLDHGQIFVDFGCGPGFFTIPAASIVGAEGRVYALDIKQELLDMVDKSATNQGLNNVLTVVSSGSNIPLDENVADFVMCGLVIHYFRDTSARTTLLKDVARILQPGGKLVLIDWNPQEAGRRKYVGRHEVLPILDGLGFTVGEVRSLRDSQYWITGIKPAVQTLSGDNVER